jgi:hypothetical protein
MLGFLVMAEQTYVLINYISSFQKKKNTEIEIIMFCNFWRIYMDLVHDLKFQLVVSEFF